MDSNRRKAVSMNNSDSRTFVNFTNHPSENWNADQKHAALKYGSIVDIMFPQVDPKATEADIKALAEKYVSEILKLRPEAVLCQGEFNLCYVVINMLKAEGVTVVAACSNRVVKDTPEGKISKFVFVQFREYKE